MPATQSQAFPHVEIRRPLVSVWTAVAILDKSEDAVLSLIEGGEIRWAWNIGLSTVHGKRDVRILAANLQDFITGAPVPRLADAEEFKFVMSFIFPSQYSRITACSFARALNCGSEHALHLMRAGAVRAVKGAVCRSAKGGSPQLTYESILIFFQTRRIV